jgi:hypothetical protein
MRCNNQTADIASRDRIGSGLLQAGNFEKKLMRAKIPLWVDRMQRMGKIGRFGILPFLAGASLLLALGGNGLMGAERAATPAVPHSDADARARVNAAAATWPLRFEENVGQVRGLEARGVRYVSRGSAYTLFLTSSEAVLVLGHHAPGVATPVVLRMRLSGGNQLPTFSALDPLSSKSNYFIGNDPSQWHTDVANFGRVAAKGVYPGIDLVYHGNQGQLEYDFELAPRADPKKIRFELEGARGLRIDSQGDLLVKVDGGELRFRRPVAYQKAGSGKQLVPVRYQLKGKNQVEFCLASYDARQPLVIDPVLSYSTYLGGSSIDGANGIAVATDGSVFIAGGTFSSDFPTAHPLQPNAGGPNDFPQDAFVSKISADGSTLAYSTYLGGKYQDVANGIAVDTYGNAYVVGTTFSPNFPVTTNVINTLCGGDGQCGATYNPNGLIVSNAFIAKLNTAGSALVYSTFLGFYENVSGHGIAVDSNFNAYVTGETSANIVPTVTITPPATPPPPFPVVGGFQTSFGGSGTDAFITKIDATASEILYSSYLGGSDEDVGFGIAVDSSANAYLTGLTYSTDLPLTAGTALQGTYSGSGDAFLAKVNTKATGSGSLAYSTYLGGNGLVQGNAVAVDTHGDAYVTGATTSTTLGFTPPAGAYRSTCTLDSSNNCEGDAFVAKLNPTLSGSASLLYFTYLGGSLADSGTGIAVDASGNVFITGSTDSTDFPIAGAVFQPHYGGGNADAFVTELNPANPPATALIYSTYLGGSNTDTGAGIAIDTSDDAYVAGQTCSLDFPLASPLQPTPGGNCDAFISKIVPAGGVSVIPAGLIFGNQDLLTKSTPQTITLTNGANSTLDITSIKVTGTDPGDFSETDTCDGSVPALGNCVITVTFAPTSITPPTRTAQITVTDSAAGSPQVVDLTGTAGTSPLVSLSSSSLVFSTQQTVGLTSAPQILTVTNTGTAALTMAAPVATGDFAVQGNTCTAPLQATTPPSNCTISVTFTPATAGESVGSLTLMDNAPNSPQIVLLTGTGVLQPAVSLSATSLAFGSQTVNTTSQAQTVTLTNVGSAALTLGTITSAGPFMSSTTCVSPLAPQAVCTISVTFTPTAGGNVLGSISIPDNATNSPQTIALSGTGVTAPIATFSPLSLTFTTPQAVGSTSGSQTVMLTNSGSATLFIDNVAASTNFGESNNCGASVNAGAQCSIYVTFAPTSVGNLYGTLSVTDNNNGAATSVQVIPLAGIGQGAPAVTLTPPSLTFAGQPLQTSSAPQTVTLTNSGSASLNITSILASGDFSATSSCGLTLAVNASCIITVTFTPTALGTRAGAVTVTDSAPNSPQMITLTGGGADFSIGVNTASVTVAAGNSTSVGVTVTPLSGFSAGVSLACSGLPALSTCTPSPASVTPSGTTVATSTLNITTTRRTAVPPTGIPRIPGPGVLPRPVIWLLWALLLMGLGGWAVRKNRRQWSWAVLAIAALWIASFAACGSSGTGYSNPTGTPAGTYTITVTGTSGNLTHSTTFTLTVQ